MAQVVGYDFTLKAEGIEPEKLIEFLKDWCKEWVFQLEKGDEKGYLHYQGRVRLIKKRRPVELKGKWRKLLPGIHISPTSTEVYKDKEFNYVMKADTREAGPWSSKEEATRKRNTTQNKLFESRVKYPWQESLIKMASEYDERTVDVIYNPKGCIGKSRIVEYMWHHDLGMTVPPMSSAEDIMQFVYSFQNKPAYLINMPKAMKKDKLAGFYAGIESLKDGLVWDKRYKGQLNYMDTPRIFIFTNSLPDMDLLSEDRWAIWTINAAKELVEFSIPKEVE